MGRKAKSKMTKSHAVSSATPQPVGSGKRKTENMMMKMRSEPQPKRKKLAQELDEEISDNEFDAMLGEMREKMKKGGKDEANSNTDEDDDDSGAEDDSVVDDEEEEEEDSDAEDDSVDEDEDDDEEEDSNAEDDSIDEVDDDDDEEVDSDNEEEDDAEEDSEDEEDDGNVDEVSEDLDSSNGSKYKISKDVKTNTSKSKSKRKRKKSKSKSGSKKRRKQKNAEEAQIEAAEMAQDLVAKASRDKRTLFLKNLPKKATVAQIRELSSDILQVRTQMCRSKSSRALRCAFLEFQDEEMAIRNKTILQDKTIDGQRVSVDFLGEKSEHRPTLPQLTSSIDPRKLYVTGFGSEVNFDELKELFPLASSVDIPRYKNEGGAKGFAFVHFSDESACKIAHGAAQNETLNGKSIIVMYAKRFKPMKLRKSKKEKKGSMKSKVNKTAKIQAEESTKNDDEDKATENDEDSDSSADENDP